MVYLVGSKLNWGSYFMVKNVFVKFSNFAEL